MVSRKPTKSSDVDPDRFEPPSSSARVSLRGISDAERSLWERRLVCIVGPSGVGKTSLCQGLLAAQPRLLQQIGTTMTAERNGEEIALNRYRIITRELFDNLALRDCFLVQQETSNGSFGIEKVRVRRALSRGRTGLIMLRSGSAHALKLELSGIRVFELVASFDRIKARIVGRGRAEAKSPQRILETVARDMDANARFRRFWDHESPGTWHQIDNDTDAEPINPVAVDLALQLLKPDFQRHWNESNV